MNYPTEDEIVPADATTVTEPWIRSETLAATTMRELRAAVAEYTRRAAVLEAELRQSQEFAVKTVDELAQAWRLLRELQAGAYDVPDGLAGRVDEFLLKE